MVNIMDQKLYGLVLAGGKSSRMGTDKSGIVYSNKPQVQVAYELVSQFCSKVFLSTRRDQAGMAVYQPFEQLHDEPEFEGKGPLGGILSAMKLYPDASWLVLACDLPFITDNTLKHLLSNRNRSAIATAYKSQHDGLPEPLCAIWEVGHFKDIQKFFESGIHCPRKILINSGVHLLEIQIPNELDNVNDPTEQREALKRLRPPTPRG
jgi:molybdopterin-guanine dinucleotide biosynthesis protein A